MTNNELNEIIHSLESQIIELESLITNGNFSKNEVISKFKNNTSSARATGINVLFATVKEVAEKTNVIAEIEKAFPLEHKITQLKIRFARCGQHLIEMISLMEEWG